jgi:Leucine-rich repeat (LRR) protein
MLRKYFHLFFCLGLYFVTIQSNIDFDESSYFPYIDYFNRNFSSSREPEINALYTLYSTTNGEEWTWRLPGKRWNFSESPLNPCGDDWQGVLCQPYQGNNSIGTITSLTLGFYNISGLLPDIFVNLTSLVNLDLNWNNFSGPLPNSFLALPNLTSVDLSYNNLRGPMPPFIFYNLSTLEFFAIAYNWFHGSFPVIPSNNKLVYIDIIANLLYGPLPQSISNLKMIKRLYTGYNTFSGTLENITTLVTADRLALNNNHFQGTLPDTFNTMKDLQYLYLHDNHLSNTLPESLGNCTKIVYFTAYTNHFSGSLPSSLRQWSKIQNFIMDANYLSNSLPDYLNEWIPLEQLIIYDNNFSGTLPSSLSKLRFLELLLLERNYFTGNPQNAFNLSLQINLQTIDLSQNKFTGQLPSEIFGKTLISFTSYKTCFSGSLPNEICNSENLQILDVDGMTSNCAKNIWPSIPNSPQYADLIHGGIPSCIWELRNLTELRMSGNGLTGTIPDLTTYGNLTNLDLSYNSFSGTIPSNLQSWKKLMTFNLQNNKFCGGIENVQYLSYAYNSYQHGVALTLSMNRLSGVIPLTLQHAYNIDIVSGNLFSCSESHQPPYHDSDSTNYVCASNLLDISLYAFIGCGSIVTLFVLCMIVLMYRLYRNSKTSTLTSTTSSVANHLESKDSSNLSDQSSYRQYQFSGSVASVIQIADDTKSLQAWLTNLLKEGLTNKRESEGSDEEMDIRDHSVINIVKIFFIKILIWRSKVAEVIRNEKHVETPNLIQFLKSLKTLRRLTIFIMLLEVFITVPLYELLKINYRTFEKQYRWEISGAFLYGYPPAIAVECLWLLLLIVVLFVLRRNIPNSLVHSNNTVLTDPPASSDEKASFVSTDEALYLAATSPVTFSLANSQKRGSDDIRRSSEEAEYQGRVGTEDDMEGRGTAGGGEGGSSFKKDPSEESARNTAISRRFRDTVAIPGNKRSTIGFLDASRRTMATFDESRKTVFNESRKTIARFTTAVKVVQEKRTWINFSTLMFNALMVICMKSACIYLLVSDNSSFDEKIIIEMSLASVDLIWGSIVLPVVISNLPDNHDTGRMLLKTTMLFFNSIMAPVLIIAVADTACFNGLFWPEPTTSENFHYTSCISYNSEDPTECEVSTSWESSSDFTPTFIYNYNCYSTVLISYIPVFLISYITLTLFVPGVSIFLLTRKKRKRYFDFFPGVYYIATPSASLPSSPSSPTGKRTEKNLKSRQSPQQPFQEEKAYDHEEGGGLGKGLTFGKTTIGSSNLNDSYNKNKSIMSSVGSCDSRHNSYRLDNDSNDLVVATDDVEGDKTKSGNNEPPKKRVILFPSFILASAMHHLLVLLTFGMMCPALAVAIALVTTTTTFTWEILIGRWMMRDQKLLGNNGGLGDDRFAGPYTTKLDELCEKVCCAPRKCFSLICFGSGFFYALALMDMAGDQQGWERALWAPISCIVAATVIYFVFTADPRNGGVNPALDNTVGTNSADNRLATTSNPIHCEDGDEVISDGGRRSSIQLLRKKTGDSSRKASDDSTEYDLDDHI